MTGHRERYSETVPSSYILYASAPPSSAARDAYLGDRQSETCGKEEEEED